MSNADIGVEVVREAG